MGGGIADSDGTYRLSGMKREQKMGGFVIFFQGSARVVRPVLGAWMKNREGGKMIKGGDGV